jgi:hypothetical protein
MGTRIPDENMNCHPDGREAQWFSSPGSDPNGSVSLPFVIPSGRRAARRLRPPKEMKTPSIHPAPFMEASPSPLSSRAKPRDLQFRRLVLEMLFEEAVWALRPVGPPLSEVEGADRQTSAQPGRVGTNPEEDPSAVGAPTFPLTCISTLSKHFQDEPAEPQIPINFGQGRLSISLRFGRDDNSYLGTRIRPCAPSRFLEAGRNASSQQISLLLTRFGFPLASIHP